MREPRKLLLITGDEPLVARVRHVFGDASHYDLTIQTTLARSPLHAAKWSLVIVDPSCSQLDLQSLSELHCPCLLLVESADHAPPPNHNLEIVVRSEINLRCLVVISNRAIHDWNGIQSWDQISQREILRPDANESVGDAVLLIDPARPDNPIVYVNRVFLSLSGYGIREVLGQNFLRFSQAEREQPGIEEIREAIANRHVAHALLRNFRESGEMYWTQTTVAPIFSADGTLIAFTLMQRDVTEQMDRKARLTRLERELYAVNRQIEMSEVATLFSHEINQPIQAATLEIESLLSDLNTHRDREPIDVTLRRVLKQVTRSGELVHSLRRFSRCGQERFGACDIITALSDVSDLMQTFLERHQIKFTSAFPRDVPPMYLDATLIQQVVMNLLKNAKDAVSRLPDNTGEIEFTAKYSESGLIVTVRDNGPGIPSDLQGQLFSAFTTRQDGSVGIGLNVCNRIIKSHSGRIWAEHPEQGGTIVRFSLPRTSLPDSYRQH